MYIFCSQCVALLTLVLFLFYAYSWDYQSTDFLNFESFCCLLSYMPSVLWHCLLGIRKSIRPLKIVWWGACVVICLERGADCWHLVQLMPLATPKSHHLLPPLNPGWFTFLVPACPGCPGKGAIKRVAAYIVCLYYCILNLDLSRWHRLVITLLLCTVVIENSLQMPIVLYNMVYIQACITAMEWL